MAKVSRKRLDSTSTISKQEMEAVKGTTMGSRESLEAGAVRLYQLIGKNMRYRIRASIRTTCSTESRLLALSPEMFPKAQTASSLLSTSGGDNKWNKVRCACINHDLRVSSCARSDS